MDTRNLSLNQAATGVHELDLSPVSVPARSQLISLTPLGCGSGGIESLWGYLQRLAVAHAVRFLDLLVAVGAPLFAGSASKRLLLGRWKDQVSAANGPTAGHKLALFFEELTGRRDLRSLTLRPISQIPGLTVGARREHAWCPCCLAEDGEPYDRLLWAISNVTHCPSHRTPLETRCWKCGSASRLFSTRSSVACCDHCGEDKRSDLAASRRAATPMDFGVWQSQQIQHLLAAISGETLTIQGLDPRAHNLRVTVSLPEVHGITGLARELGVGRATPWEWLHHDRSIQLKFATRWAWLTGTNLKDLFSRKLTPDEFRFRALPSDVRLRSSRLRRPAVPSESTALYLAALRLSAANPFIAPRIPALEKASGVHIKHQAYRDVHFVRLIGSLREKERLFRRKERVWREVNSVHAAVLKVAAKKLRLGRNRVAAEMDKPGCFGGPLARNYLRWMKNRLAHRDTRVLSPKKVPLDVRAFWDLQKQDRRA